MTPTQSILAFAAAAHTLPPEIAAAATALLGDTLAVGAAGSSAPGADGVYAAAQLWGAGDDAPLLGRGGRLPAPAAAFVNGFQIHSLEWDAVHEVAVVHAMSVVTASLHAVCARAAARGAAVAPDRALVALAVGVDIACGLGLAATEGMRFFRPATAGLIGAALACARVAGTPPAAFSDVLGLAVSQASGTMQAHVEGSQALPLQIAAAARAAVTAVDLANAGLTGPHDALEGPFGYFKLFDAGVIERYSASIGSGWRIGEVSIKPWPSGRAAHATLGVLAAMMLDQKGAWDALVERHAPPEARQRILGRHDARHHHGVLRHAVERVAVPGEAADVGQRVRHVHDGEPAQVRLGEVEVVPRRREDVGLHSTTPAVLRPRRPRGATPAFAMAAAAPASNSAASPPASAPAMARGCRALSAAGRGGRWRSVGRHRAPPRSPRCHGSMPPRPSPPPVGR